MVVKRLLPIIKIHTMALFGTVDYVMQNPPFNVDEVDAEKVKNDPRLPFGLPGTIRPKKCPTPTICGYSIFTVI